MKNSDQGGPPAEAEGQQGDDDEDGEHQRLDQLVDLLVGGDLFSTGGRAMNEIRPLVLASKRCTIANRIGAHATGVVLAAALFGVFPATAFSQAGAVEKTIGGFLEREFAKGGFPVLETKKEAVQRFADDLRKHARKGVDGVVAGSGEVTLGDRAYRVVWSIGIGGDAKVIDGKGVIAQGGEINIAIGGSGADGAKAGAEGGKGGSAVAGGGMMQIAVAGSGGKGGAGGRAGEGGGASAECLEGGWLFLIAGDGGKGGDGKTQAGNGGHGGAITVKGDGIGFAGSGGHGGNIGKEGSGGHGGNGGDCTVLGGSRGTLHGGNGGNGGRSVMALSKGGSVGGASGGTAGKQLGENSGHSMSGGAGGNGGDLEVR